MIRQKNWIFICFNMFVLTGLIWSLGIFQTHFASQEDSQFLSENLKFELQKLKSENQLLGYQFEDFRQNAALHWPEARKKDYRWPASVVLDLSSSHYEKGRVLFKKGQFSESVQSFELLIAEFPYSKWITESYYYRCESYFQLRDFKNFSACAAEMAELFPENTLTGFQLLRLAQTHEIHGQLPEAFELYRLVENQFSNEKVLLNQAGESVARLRGEF